MILTSLELTSFRNYKKNSITFHPEQNIFAGKNAQGKTNLLEAIYLLCITRSFRTHVEKDLIHFEDDECTLKGEFTLADGKQRTIVFYYTKKEGKRLSVNRNRVDRFSGHIGQFPIVLSSPEEYNITTGPPAERRRFFDILLSQLNKKYVYNLQEYHRILKQRNKILSDFRFSKTQISKLLEPWNDSLTEKGSQIIWDRSEFVNIIRDDLKKIYSNLSTGDESLDFKYRTKINNEHLNKVTELFRTFLASQLDAEIEQRKTLIGPHRDDFVFFINGKELRKFGSRGQHKTVLISLMIAEFNVLKKRRSETPIIIVDDLYSEIDQFREERIVDYLQDMGQVFITTTNPIETLKPKMKKTNVTYFQIDGGRIENIE